MRRPAWSRTTAGLVGLAAVVGILQTGVLVACGADGPEEPPEGRGKLTIYSSLPLQGDAKPQSEDIQRAFELALEENEGRAGGYDIQYVSLDDADPAVGAWTALARRSQ